MSRTWSALKNITLGAVVVALVIAIAVVIAKRPQQASAGNGKAIVTAEYDNRAGVVVAQLLAGGGFTANRFQSPFWTLYGDGTLIYQGLDDSKWKQAHLTQQEVLDLLNFAVHDQQFFDGENGKTYGNGDGIADYGYRYVYLHINGHTQWAGIDYRADSPLDFWNNIHAVYEHYYDYRPADGDDYHIAGMGVIAHIDTETEAGAQWPFPSVPLSSIAQRCCDNQEYYDRVPTKVVGVIDPGVEAFLTQPRSVTFVEGGQTYRIETFPLFPDALTPPTGQVPTIHLAPSVLVVPVDLGS